MKERVIEDFSEPAGVNNATQSAPLTDDELRKLTRERLIQLLQDKTIGGAVSLAVCREIADRLDGKPLQRSEGKLDMRVLSLSARLDDAIAREQAIVLGVNQPIVPKLK